MVKLFAQIRVVRIFTNRTDVYSQVRVLKTPETGVHLKLGVPTGWFYGIDVHEFAAEFHSRLNALSPSV